MPTERAASPSMGPPRWAVALACLGALCCAAVAIHQIAAALSQRYERDIARMIYNRNVDLLSAHLKEVEGEAFTLRQKLEGAPDPDPSPVAPDAPYLVLSLADKKISLRKGEDVLFEAEVAIGKGAVTLDGKTRRFDTPRGRRTVIAKEEDPVWVAPYWHYQEQAQRRGLALRTLNRGESIPLEGGASVTVQGLSVGRLDKDGRFTPYAAAKDVVVGGMVIVPPFGTKQRRFPGELGTRRLHLGDGYAIHGTDKEGSIGTAASHGCIRMRNAEIELLYDRVDVGTVVYIY